MLRLPPENARIVAGTIRAGGTDLPALSEAALRRTIRGRRIAMVFQDPMTALNPVRAIGDQIADIQRRARGLAPAERRRRAVAALARVGLPDPERALARHPFRVSGGQRQRIALAMGLMQRPQLLIADGVTTALDVTLEAQILHLLRELRSEIDGSILFISHDLGAIAEICDRVVLLYAGEVVEEGPARAIFHAPRHPYTRALIACDPARIDTATRTLPVTPGEVPDLARVPPGCIFAPRCREVLPRCGGERPAVVACGPGPRARCHLLAAEPGA